MPVRFEIRDGMLKVVQSFDFPAVYLDHWAVRAFSSDVVLGQRFRDALKAVGGTLVISHLNLAELTGPADPRHAEEAARFFEAVLPNVYFAMFDVEAAINQEHRHRMSNVRLPAPPDMELLVVVGKERPDDCQPFTIANVIRMVAAHREKLGATWNDINDSLAARINQVRSNIETVKQARNFTGHPIHIPTLAIMQELLRPLFIDQSQVVGRTDAADIQHAIMSIAYCDYSLLDGKWEALHSVMARRFAELHHPIRLAKVFSKRRQGVEGFLKELEGASQRR